MAMNMVSTDTKLRMAVYGIVRNDGERAAHGLIMQACIENGSDPVGYVDEGFPRHNHGSAWDRLVADVAKRQFYGVVMRWHVKGFKEYCWQYDTRLVVLKNGEQC